MEKGGDEFYREGNLTTEDDEESMSLGSGGESRTSLRWKKSIRTKRGHSRDPCLHSRKEKKKKENVLFSIKRCRNSNKFCMKEETYTHTYMYVCVCVV